MMSSYPILVTNHLKYSSFATLFKNSLHCNLIFREFNNFTLLISLVQFWLFHLSLSSHVKSNPVLLFFLTCLPFPSHFPFATFILLSSLIYYFSSLSFLPSPPPRSPLCIDDQSRLNRALCHRESCLQGSEGPHLHVRWKLNDILELSQSCLCALNSPMRQHAADFHVTMHDYQQPASFITSFKFLMSLNHNAKDV